jgi:predicted DNA-binding transcriptional regulator YafY
MTTLVSKVVSSSDKVKSYIKDNPGVSIERLTEELKIKPASLYHVLYALIDDPQVCDGTRFKVTQQGSWITVSEVQSRIAQKTGKKNVSAVERVIFLYTSLFEAVEDGGLTFEQIRNRYEELMETPRSSTALKRMIYRDITLLSESLPDRHAGLRRPEGGNKKYCLNLDYIPRLMPESAAAVYLGMTLLKDTVMDEPVAYAQKEIGKAYLKKQGKNINVFRQRFYSVKDTLAEPKKFGKTFRALVKAVLESYCIRMVYEKITGERLDRLVEPLGMLCKRGVWYLIARNQGAKEIRIYRVDQIFKVYPRDRERFEYPRDFTVESYVGDSWGVYSDDEVRRVTLKFSPEVAPRVKNLCYHRSQSIAEECPDGSVVLEFNVCGHVELVSWILQWGHQVEVIEPEDLRERVREMALAIAERYK